MTQDFLNLFTLVLLLRESEQIGRAESESKLSTI